MNLAWSLFESGSYTWDSLCVKLGGDRISSTGSLQVSNGTVQKVSRTGKELGYFDTSTEYDAGMIQYSFGNSNFAEGVKGKMYPDGDGGYTQA